MADNIVVNNDASLIQCIKMLTDTYERAKYVRVTLIEGRNRTLDQNALSFQLYTDLHKAKSDVFPSVDDARAYCKLHFGIGIRRQEDDYNSVYATMIKDRFSYEEKLKLMVDPVDFPVTRGMSRAQFSQYVEMILNAFPDVNFRSINSEGE